MSDQDEPTGYKRPPKATRWKTGESGNPRGRVKGERNLKTELLEEIFEEILIKEGGVPKKVTKARAMLKAQAAKAVQGDTKAAALIMATMQRLLDPPPPTPETVVSDNDRAIVEAFLKRNANNNGG
ncbi:DUF5681 domain-containing protein [Mesorhizobium sp.]|uniref:DUF5681 domain-containing protein n=1 Tax=Mesorhizobium sp. TaxID=1871066 RepID=UPI000FE5CE26|nr:DUF5681 domain-containing protein [Mesorhizobium sp.]RWE64690.1 MAG: hypothetical protein EOS62_28235 [Mesorhizobium sp.]